MIYRILIMYATILLFSCNRDCEEIKTYYPNGTKKETRYYSDCNYKWNYKKYHFHENGEKQYEGQFVNGLKNGKFKTWTKHGILTADWTMINGKSNGLTQCWYNNGIKKKEINIVNGVDHGAYTDWNEDGTLKCKGFFKKGERDSLWVYFGQNGALKKLFYKNGQLNGNYYDHYFDSDSVLLFEKGQYFMDEKIGEWNVFYPGKTLKSTRNYLNGKLDGEYIEYYKNGKIKRIDIFKSGHLELIKTVFDKHGKITLKDGNGEYFSYHKNGNIESIIPSKNSKRVGLAKWYYETGEIEQTIVYVNDLRTITTKYFTNGVASELNHYTSDSIIERKLAHDFEGNITLKNGTGIVYDYFDSGELQYVGNYINSKRTGVAKWYYKNGQLMESTLFKDNEPIEILNAYYEDGTDRDFEQIKKTD